MSSTVVDIRTGGERTSCVPDPRDLADLDRFFKTRFGSSATGAMLDRCALYDLGTIRAMSRKGLLDDPGDKNKTVEVHPNNIMGSGTQSAGYEVAADDMVTWARVSRAIQRMGGMWIGNPPLTADSVLAVSWQYGGDFRGRTVGPELEHLTASGMKMLAQAATLATGWGARMRNKGKLTGKEVEFVELLDMGPEHEAILSGAPLQKGDKRRNLVPYRNAAARVFGGDDPVELANELLRKPAIRQAIDERKAAEVLLSKRPHDMYAVVAGTGCKGYLKPMKRRAEAEGVELFKAMWRAWNEAARVGR